MPFRAHVALVDHALLIRAIEANTELHLRILIASVSLLSIGGIVDYLVNQVGYVLVAGTVFTRTCKLRLTVVDILLLLLIRLVTWGLIFQVGEIRLLFVGCSCILILLMLSTPFCFGGRGRSDFWGGRLVVHYYIGV
jgi:hypothetical protein